MSKSSNKGKLSIIFAAASLGIAALTVAGCAAEPESTEVSDILQGDGVDLLKPLNKQCPSTPVYTYDQVAIACCNAYPNAQQCNACIQNICSCYTCTD